MQTKGFGRRRFEVSEGYEPSIDGHANMEGSKYAIKLEDGVHFK